MKNCTHCGAENLDENFHCVQCAALLTAEPFRFALWPGRNFRGVQPAALLPRPLFSFALFPRSPAEWTRSLAFALFLACVISLAFRSWATTDRAVWYYLAPSVGCILLPILGAALLSFCVWGKTLPNGFRVLGMGVACFSILVLFMPVRDPFSDVVIREGWRGIGFSPGPFGR
jgi:hypothetical protein